jgi:hypothetical protein
VRSLRIRIRPKKAAFGGYPPIRSELVAYALWLIPAALGAAVHWAWWVPFPLLIPGLVVYAPARPRGTAAADSSQLETGPGVPYVAAGGAWPEKRRSGRGHGGSGAAKAPAHRSLRPAERDKPTRLQMIWCASTAGQSKCAKPPGGGPVCRILHAQTRTSRLPERRGSKARPAGASRGVRGRRPNSPSPAPVSRTTRAAPNIRPPRAPPAGSSSDGRSRVRPAAPQEQGEELCRSSVL